MASRASSSRRRRSITPCHSIPAPDDYKAAMREVKSLYLGRRYKQCAAVATDVLRKFSGQLHSLHESYLRYYAAASYETLGHTAHNFSSNKIPLLYMAKDEYLGCKIALDVALQELQKEKSKIPPSIDDIEKLLAQNPIRLERPPAPPLFGDGLSRARRPLADKDPNIQSRKPREEFTSRQEKGGADFSSPFYSSSSDDSDDQVPMSVRAKLMPPPLSIRKSYAGPSISTGSPIPKATRKSGRPLSVPQDATPLFSLSPLKPAKSCRKPPTTQGEKPRVFNQDRKMRYSRMAAQITSLSAQIIANIKAVNCLVEKTTELQRVHNATKPQRLASFWSFTPAADTPSPTNNVTKYNSVSGSSTNSSRRSSSTAASSVARPTVDDAKQERIERLRAQEWRTVGIRDPERKWKGPEYYEKLCNQALSELYGV